MPRAAVTAALDEEDDVLEAADPGGAGVHHLDLPAVGLRVLGVHPREVRGEERGLVAAGAGPDLDEDVLVVVRVRNRQGRDAFLGGDRLDLESCIGRQLVHVLRGAR